MGMTDEKICHVCGCKMEYKNTMFHGIQAKCWTCTNCGEKLFSSAEVKRMEKILNGSN